MPRPKLSLGSDSEGEEVIPRRRQKRIHSDDSVTSRRSDDPVSDDTVTSRKGDEPVQPRPRRKLRKAKETINMDPRPGDLR